MALPTSTEPLRLAVLHALTSPTGKPRAIQPGLLYEPALDAQGSVRAGAPKATPSVYVVVRDHAPDPDSLGLEGSSIRRESVLVEITCSYWSGNPTSRSEMGETLARIEADRQRLLGALLYPEALRYDPDGQDAGLDGGSLRWDGYSSTGPAPLPVPSGSPRVLQVVHRFRAKVELSQLPL